MLTHGNQARDLPAKTARWSTITQICEGACPLCARSNGKSREIAVTHGPADTRPTCDNPGKTPPGELPEVPSSPPHCLDVPVLGAYARYVLTTEINREGFTRLLPGDGAGVGCVSPLHATCGRFQVMTTGR